MTEMIMLSLTILISHLVIDCKQTFTRFLLQYSLIRLSTEYYSAFDKYGPEGQLFLGTLYDYS